MGISVPQCKKVHGFIRSYTLHKVQACNLYSIIPTQQHLNALDRLPGVNL